MNKTHYIDYLRQTCKILTGIKASSQRIGFKLKSMMPHIMNLKGNAGMFGFEEISLVANKFLSVKESEKIKYLDDLLNLINDVLSDLDKSSFYNHVLIIDDDEHIRALIKAKLKSKNIEVQETLSIQQSESIDFSEIGLILLDLTLPDGDGRKLLCQLQRKPETCNIPIWIFSAIENRSLINECILLGAEKYIVKPINPVKLADMILNRLVLEKIDYQNQLENMISEVPELKENSLLQIILFDMKNSCPASENLLVLDEFLSSFVDDSKKMKWKTGRLLLLINKNRITDCKSWLENFYKNHNLDENLSIYVISSDYLDNKIEVIINDMFSPVYKIKTPKPGIKWLDSQKTETIREINILLADDDPMILKLVSHRLIKEGYKTIECENGDELLKMMKKIQPDLVIMDVKMPVFDGFQTLKKIRDSSEFNQIPVILLTSLGSEENVLKGFQLGVTDYMTKPFSPVELVARVNRILEEF